MPGINKNNKKCCNDSALFQLIKSLSYCMVCSSFIFKDNSPSIESQIVSIKPENFPKNNEISSFLWNVEEKESNLYINKKNYLKQRSPIIKNIKKISSYFSLSLKTYFLSVAYLDKICSKISFFNQDAVFQISLFCLILAAKFNENASKATFVQNSLRKNISKNYALDEMYVLNLLDYELNVYTSYDMLIDIMNFGFVFQGENFNHKKLNYIYLYLEKILYIYSEINNYIDFTSKQITLSIIGFARELMDLTPFTDIFKKIFLINSENEQIYISGLNLIKKRIKIEGGIANKKKDAKAINCTKAKIKRDSINAKAICCNEIKTLA